MSFFQSIAYAAPSAFVARPGQAELGLAADQQRPVRFQAWVAQHGFVLRTALRALGQAIWSADHWDAQDEFAQRVLDPVITVHPDRLWFEAFTQDLGAYLSLRVDPEVFETEGAVQYGTTNIDFSAWLWGALGEMRSSRRTRFRVGAEGFELHTEGGGGRFEAKVELPDNWVRGFLQVQAAMALPGTRLQLRPVDLLAAIRFLQQNKAKVSPRGLRYELQPGQDAALLIEPWDQRVPLVGASHGYTEPRSIRTWGRRKLALIEPLLPFAERVDVYLKGRALPSFYAVQLPGMCFVLGLSGTGAGSGFGGGMSGGGALHLLLDSQRSDAATQQQVLAALAARFHASTEALATACGLPLAACSQALAALNRAGRVMWDVETREWRHRELFHPPVDAEALFPPEPRVEAAAALLAQPGAVQLHSAEPEVQVQTRRFRDPRTGAPIERKTEYRQWRLLGRCAEHETELVVSAEERIVFGRCGCAHFAEHLLNQGPCAHMLALLRASEAQRQGA